MKKNVFLLLLVIVMISCQPAERKQENAHTVSVSILPQKYFIEKIAGDLFEINVLIPPGASPATYEPTPGQLTALSKSEIYMKIGYTGFEQSWMDKLASANREMEIIDLSEGVELIMEEHHQHGSHEHGSVDPHIWLSPRNVKIISNNIYRNLAQKYPEHNEIFQKNLQSFMNELDSLDKAIELKLSNLSSKSFMIYHPALSYFARDYKLTQLPMELEGKSPSSAHMKEMVDTGKALEIGIIFLQMQFDQHNAEVLAKEIGARIVQINPLDPEWKEQVLYITEQLKSLNQ